MSSDEHSGYESPVPQRPTLIALGVGGFILFTAIAMGLLYLFYFPFAHREPLKVSKFPAPRLQIDPSEDLDAVDEAQRARLNRTQWLDPAKTQLAIPINSAMKVVAGRGAQAYAPLPNAPETAPGGRPPGAMAPGGRRFNPGAGPDAGQADKTPEVK